VAHDLIRMLMGLAFGAAGALLLYWALTFDVPRRRSRRHD
jgi:hypothetical protein